MGIGAEAAGDEHAEAAVDRAVVEGAGRGDDADVVEHRLTAVGLAAREVDLELARQPLRERMAEEMLERSLGPRRDVEILERARAGEMAGLHVADGVAARLTCRHAGRREVAHDRRDVFEVDEVELNVLSGGDVAPAAGVRVGDVPHEIHLLGQRGAVRDLDPHHLVVAALSLAVDAVVQAEDAEDVLVEVPGEVAGELVLELLDVGELRWIDLALQHQRPSQIRPRRSGFTSVTNPIGLINIPAGPTVSDFERAGGRSCARIRVQNPLGRLGSAGPEQFGDLEGQVEGLAAVEAGVAHRLVAVVEVAVVESPRRRRGTRSRRRP